jgi:hypothetical protein
MIQQNLMQQTIHISRLTGRVRRVRMILFRDIRKWSIMQRANIYDIPPGFRKLLVYNFETTASKY